VVTEALLVVLAYGAGSVPFGVLLTRWLKGVDVRSQGSGNIGATNVTRMAGKKLGGTVLALDALKGFLPVLVAQHLLPDAPRVHVVVALAAVLGHIFPVWLGFRGGKGVATALGALLALEPWAAAAGAAVYLAIVLKFRVSSVGSLLGAVTAVVVAFLSPAPESYAWMTAGLLLLLVWTHRGNLARLWRRQER
jgi:glycerol-3-phosphate acyltransferase PlsY